MRGATAYLHLLSPIFVNISIHAPHARSDTHGIGLSIQRMHISIHAPHARSDIMGGALFIMAFISIHAPHARSDSLIDAIPSATNISIHAPHARSDRRRHDALPDSGKISIHAPHARSDRERNGWGGSIMISIHAPHARSDAWRVDCTLREFKFQSTLLMRGATAPSIDMCQAILLISIHAPHARSDASCIRLSTLSSDFNPRSSCEERPLPCNHLGIVQ